MDCAESDPRKNARTIWEKMQNSIDGRRYTSTEVNGVVGRKLTGHSIYNKTGRLLSLIIIIIFLNSAQAFILLYGHANVDRKAS